MARKHASIVTLASAARNTITLPGNTTKSDVVHLLRMAKTVIVSPQSVSPTDTYGLVLALENLAAGIE